MNKHTWAIAKLNLKNIKIPYFVTVLIFSIMFVQSIVYTIISVASKSASDQLQISSGSYLWLLIILAAIYIPSKNFRRIVNLGGKRDGYFQGALLCYAILAAAVTIANSFLYYTYERLLINTGYYIGFDTFLQNPALMDSHYTSVNIIEVFGWPGNGAVLALIQQFAFLFLMATVIHTLTAMQDKWYGWVTDIIIAAILGIFIPIAPLRAWLIKFFNLIIFNSNALIQIVACILLAIAVYALSKPVFARKAI